jgi:hypothetical protein
MHHRALVRYMEEISTIYVFFWQEFVDAGNVLWS